MERIEIWPTDFEFGDAIAGDMAINYLRAVDTNDGREVLIYLDAPTTERFLALLDDLRAIVAAKDRPRPN